MGWNWLTGFAEFFTGKEEKPPEPLVLGAELVCPCGTSHSYLYLDTEDINIANLPQANIGDCIALYNIRSFGTCKQSRCSITRPCEKCMDLAVKWENPQPQTMLVNGEEVITTDSTLICYASGREIYAVTSGQDGVFASQLALFREMDEKYPGLLAILLDPYGSLYLNEGMYELALQFLADQIAANDGELFLPTIFDKGNVEGGLIRAVLERLLPDCDASSFDRLMNGLEIAGSLNGMDTVPGWDARKLNEKMLEMLMKDCKATSEKIATDPLARAAEENKQFMSILGDAVLQLAYMAMLSRVTSAGAGKPSEGKGGTYTNFDDGLNFSKKALEHMGESGRQVPMQILQDAIRYGEAMPDPRGSSATMYYTTMYKNGKMYNLEVLYDEVTNTVYHYEYTRKAIGNLPAISK